MWAEIYRPTQIVHFLYQITAIWAGAFDRLLAEFGLIASRIAEQILLRIPAARLQHLRQNLLH